jgi:hypothetical protein
MALISDYEIPGTGVVVPNAYHVITHLDVEKRVTASAEPPSNYSANKPNDDSKWVAGYYGRIVVQVWKDAEHKANGGQMLGVINANNKVNPVFMVDPSSGMPYLEQAYAHLMRTDYYKDAVPD